jgi:hypothetical protein
MGQSKNKRNKTNKTNKTNENQKIRRNDKCFCKSGKKYKNCCLSKAEEMKRKELEKYEIGHEDTSENIKICAEYFREEYPDHKTIDISDILTYENYRNFQVFNYTNKTIMLAEKNDYNQEVFTERDNGNNDLIIMYRGSYRTCQIDQLDKYVESIDVMVEKRLAGEEDN